MDEELKKIRRHNRIVWLLLSFLILLVVTSMAITYSSPKTDTVNNYVGQDGKDGLSAEVDYQKVTNYINQAVLSLPKAKDGTDGKDGIDATVDYGLLYAYVDARIAALPKPVDGVSGIDGADGEPGKTPEVACLNGDYVTRYPGDDAWRVLQESSAACTEAHHP